MFKSMKTGKMEIMSPETARITGAIFNPEFKLIRSISDTELAEYVKKKTEVSRRHMLELRKVV